MVGIVSQGLAVGRIPCSWEQGVCGKGARAALLGADKVSCPAQEFFFLPPPQMKADKPSYKQAWKKLHHEIPMPVRKLGGCKSLLTVLTACSCGDGTSPREEELRWPFPVPGAAVCGWPLWTRLMRWDILALDLKLSCIQALFPQVKDHCPAVPSEMVMGC